MFTTKNGIFLALCFSLTACSSLETQRPKTCTSKEACLTDPNCECWCSQSCGYRKKTPEDRPVYIENDPNGKYCYCKQWDFDHYKDNCIDHKNVLQPKGAK